MSRNLVIAGCAAPLPLALIGIAALGLYRAPATEPKLGVPVTTVKRSDVSFAVSARGELQGGKTQMLTVPMTGGGSLTITSLRSNGEEVKQDDVVVAFDTTEQEFNLREAEADLAEAQQQLIQAENENQAREEETRAQLIQARTDVRVNELEVSPQRGVRAP